MKELLDLIRWREVIADLAICLICIFLFGWFGIVIFFIIHFLGRLGGGMMLDVFGDYPTEEPEHTTMFTDYHLRKQSWKEIVFGKY